MSFIAHYHNKKTGVTYCYRVTSYRDPETGKPRSHRVLIGKLNEAGEIVPTQKKGRPRKPDKDAVLGTDIVKALATKEVASLTQELQKLKEERHSLLEQIAALKVENGRLQKAMKSVASLLRQQADALENRTDPDLPSAQMEPDPPSPQTEPDPPSPQAEPDPSSPQT